MCITIAGRKKIYRGGPKKSYLLNKEWAVRAINGLDCTTRVINGSFLFCELNI